MIGSIIGILLGVGVSIVVFLGYNEVKRFLKKKELFGYGSIEGIVGFEVVNNVVIGGLFILIFILGILGESVIVVLFGGFMI